MGLTRKDEARLSCIYYPWGQNPITLTGVSSAMVNRKGGWGIRTTCISMAYPFLEKDKAKIHFTLTTELTGRWEWLKFS